MAEFAETITIDASPEKVWKTLADIGNIYIWNPGVEHSKQTTSGEVGIGSCRRCELGGRNYLIEEVIAFEPASKMTIRITDSNLPFKSAVIRFLLQPQEGQTVVKVSPNYHLKFGWLGRLFDVVIVRAQYRKGMRRLLLGLKEHVENRIES